VRAGGGVAGDGRARERARARSRDRRWEARGGGEIGNDVRRSEGGGARLRYRRLRGAVDAGRGEGEGRRGESRVVRDRTARGD